MELQTAIEEAERCIAHFGGVDISSCYFYFICEECEETSILRDPNTAFEKGVCYKCKHIMDLKEVGCIITADEIKLAQYYQDTHICITVKD